MKKIAFAALAIALVGGNAFAEDPAIKVTGYLNSGAKIVTTEDGTTFQNYGLDYDDVGTWGKIGAEFAGEKSGFNVTIVASSNKFDTDGDEAADAVVGLDTAYAWLSPYEGVKLFAGTSYNGAFDGLDDNGADYFDTTGASVVYSIAGFDLGVGATLGADASSSADTVFGLAYALKDVAALRASVYVDAGESKVNAYSVTASLDAVTNLTLTAGAYAEGFALDATRTSGVDATVGYKVLDALSAQVVTYYTFENEDFEKEGVVIGSASKLEVAPRVTYTLTPELKVYAQDKVVFVDNEYSTQVLRLNAAYAVDGASSITARYQYDTDAETSTIYLDYLVSF